MKKTIKGKLTLNTAIFIVAAIIVCEIVSVKNKHDKSDETICQQRGTDQCTCG